ncbi:LysR family transcriptional regulator [Pseudomonas sp. v388]|uniref:helix-turn-helix domain-containing protein n=1 Tax=Pseudomonas sp. v388 TaxID=2479849 RepID=UPI0013153D65|nr:LysR family transcriptional regulator [Pseudomonas sp. v388]
MPTFLKRVDLAKLIVFMTVFRERNVSTAALRLGVTQPAVSNCLRDLRHDFADDLFLRMQGMMKPTPKAEAIAAALLPGLEILSHAVMSFASPMWCQTLEIPCMERHGVR